MGIEPTSPDSQPGILATRRRPPKIKYIDKNSPIKNTVQGGTAPLRALWSFFLVLTITNTIRIVFKLVV